MELRAFDYCLQLKHLLRLLTSTQSIKKSICLWHVVMAMQIHASHNWDGPWLRTSDFDPRGGYKSTGK